MKNCAPRMRALLNTEGTVFPNMDRPRPEKNFFFGKKTRPTHVRGQVRKFRPLPELVRLYDL